MNAQTNSLGLIETKPVRIAMIGLLLALLSACGSNVTPRAGASYSTGGPASSVPLVGTSGAGEAQCTPFDSTSTRLAGRATSYYLNGVLQEDRVRVRITSLVEAFDTNSNYYIQAFRWKVGSSGTAEIDSTAVQFQFEKGAGSDTPISALATSVNLTGISSIRSSAGISGTGAVDFFSKTTMVVRGVDYNWQALKIVVYDGSVTPARIVGQTDFLLPIFEANPNVYANAHSSIVANLHPFIAQRSQTLSETEWAQRSMSYCF